MGSAPAIVSVRVSEEERSLLQAAAAHARTNLSDFIRRKAVEAAEIDLAGQQLITIPADAWSEFEAWSTAPARDDPRLRRLAGTPPTWQD